MLLGRNAPRGTLEASAVCANCVRSPKAAHAAKAGPHFWVAVPREAKSAAPSLLLCNFSGSFVKPDAHSKVLGKLKLALIPLH
jgi:hypothetical protein